MALAGFLNNTVEASQQPCSGERRQRTPPHPTSEASK